MIRGYLDVLCAAQVGQKFGPTNARDAGNEFALLDVLAPKINVSLVRRSVAVRVGQRLRRRAKNVGVSLLMVLGG